MRSTGKGMRFGVVALGLVLVTSACGMRVSKDEIVAAASGSEVRSTDGDLTEGGELGALEGSATEVGEAGAAAAGSSGGGSARAGSTGGGAAGGSGGGRGPQAARAAGAPVKIASVGTLSGPAGATLLPSVQGVQAWVRFINDSGGLNGHPVNLTVVDDGGDSARHRSIVQDLVENKGIVAFVNNTEALTGAGSVSYLESKQVPVIGTDTSVDYANTSPIYFPQAATGRNLILAAAGGPAKQAVAKGLKRAGILSCSEAQVCRDLIANGPAAAEHYGMEVVYSAQASLAQPDFTAECLNARNANVELLLMSMDSNSVGRIARSCAQQGFRPQFGFGASIIVDTMKNDANFNEHLLGDTNVFPWFQDNTPATREFHAAAKKYGLTLGVGAATGWTSGKLLQKAGANLTEPTSAAILKGLWSIKNDNLGGLTAPLTFAEGQPAKTGACWFAIQIQANKWVSPDNFSLTCF